MDRDGSSLLWHVLGFRSSPSSRLWLGVPRVVDGNGFRGQTVVVHVRVLHAIEVNRSERTSGAFSPDDGDALVKELFIFGVHLNERTKKR